MLTAHPTHESSRRWTARRRPARAALARAAVAVAAAWLVLVSWQPARAAERAPCTLVVGQGRHPTDAEAENAGWDRINTTLATQVGSELAAQGERTLLLTLPVTFDDVARVVAAVIDNARRSGCDRVVETSLFLMPDDETLVARLRAYPLRPGDDVIGDPVHVSQREYPNTQRNRDRLQPAALGRELAADYLRDPVSARPRR